MCPPCVYADTIDAGGALVLCNVDELKEEVRQYIPAWSQDSPARSALWIEPQVLSWREQLMAISEALPPGAPLVVIARARWPNCCREELVGRASAGCRWRGFDQLRGALAQSGFGVQAVYGIHSASAIALNLLAQQCEWWGLPELGARLYFAARLRYCRPASAVSLSTVSLLMARKESI